MIASRSPWKSTFVASFAIAASPVIADGIFQDDFEECGAGRWSAGNPDPQVEQIAGLLPLDLAEALGACEPSLTGAAFVLADGTVPDATALGQMSDKQSAILASLGTGGMLPTSGGAMIALSSGLARDQAHNEFGPPEPGVNFNRCSAGPAPFMTAHGNVFPGLPGCGNGPNNVCDSVGLRLTFTVPPGADRLAIDWRFLTANYPEWVCTAYVDYFLGIVVTGTHPSLPIDRNVVLDSVSRPISVDSPDIVVCTGCSAGDGELAGTLYSTSAAATLWHTASVPVVEEETLVVDLLAFDVGDALGDNLVLLDGMRWISD